MKTTLKAVVIAFLMGMAIGGVSTSANAAVNPSGTAETRANSRPVARTAAARQPVLVAGARDIRYGQRRYKKRRKSLLKRYKRRGSGKRKYRVGFKRRKKSKRRH